VDQKFINIKFYDDFLANNVLFNIHYLEETIEHYSWGLGLPTTKQSNGNFGWVCGY
jgi:hypothetical protein